MTHTHVLWTSDELRSTEHVVVTEGVWTPATNLLPIRRSSIGVGASVGTTSAWLRFPEFELTPARQIYERISDDVWRYRSSTADAVLETTADGIVTRYGDGLWLAEAVVTR